MKIVGSHGEFEVNPNTGEVVGEVPGEYRYVLLVDTETLKPHCDSESVDILHVGYLYQKDDGKIDYEPPEVTYQQWLDEVHG